MGDSSLESQVELTERLFLKKCTKRKELRRLENAYIKTAFEYKSESVQVSKYIQS